MHSYCAFDAELRPEDVPGENVSFPTTVGTKCSEGVLRTMHEDARVS